MKIVEKFEVKIMEEDGEFAIDIELSNGEILQGYASNIFESYDKISELLTNGKAEGEEK
jgi:hypothetical protein